MRVLVGEAGGEAPPAAQFEADSLPAVAHGRPRLAERRGGLHAGKVVASRARLLGADGSGAEGGRPAVVRAGADLTRRADAADEAVSVEQAEVVLDGALGQPGEPHQLARGEHLVGAEQGDELAPSRREHSKRRLGLGSRSRWRGGLGPGVRPVRTTFDMGFCNMGCMPMTGSVANERGMRPRSVREVISEGAQFVKRCRRLRWLFVLADDGEIFEQRTRRSSPR